MNVEKLRRQAKNENTKQEILIELAKNQDDLTRHYVAINPNTPVETLEELGEEFPEAVTGNPIFNLLIFDNPDSKFIRLSLARSSTTSADVLEKLIQTEDIEIFCAIASNPNVSARILEKLGDWIPPNQCYYRFPDLINSLHHHITSNRKTPDRILEKLAVYYSDRTREIFRNNKNASQKTLDKLFDRHPFTMLLAIAKNPNTPTHILERLAGESYPNIRHAVLRHQNVSVTAIKIVRFIEGNLKNSTDLLEILAKDVRSQIRELVAKHPDTPANILILLAHDKELEVLQAVARNPNTPALALERLAGESDREIRKAVLNHPRISHTTKEIIKFLKHKTKISTSILERLADDDRIYIRKLIVNHNDTPSRVLKKLINDPKLYISQKAIEALENRSNIM